MTRPSTEPGRLIAGRYRLASRIGGGGMGTVWLARDELLGRQVAVKQVLSPLGADERQIDEQRRRALREGRIAARLSHPHAISVYDVALEGGAPWLVMEYLPSRSLAEVLDEDGPLRVDQVGQIGAQVADALAATHAAGIVHRDVKPANVLIGQGGAVAGLVKITDFGISHARGDVTLTQTGQITGTPAFLAPEVAQGREMTEASDVFSLGATLYTCLEGRPPFGMEDNALGMLHRVAAGQITPPQRAGVLTAPLLRMLAADPTERPPMTEVRDELARLAAGHGGDTTTVLLARTDLRPSSGPAGTAVFAAGAAGSEAAASEAPPTPIPPAARMPVPPPATARHPWPAGSGAAPAGSGGPRTSPDGRRRRGVWAGLGVAAALLLGGGAVWLGTSGDPDPGDTAAGASPSVVTEAPQTSEPAPVTEEPPAPEPEPTTPPPPEVDDEDEDEDRDEDDGRNGDPLSERNVRDFVREYHRLVLEDPAAAWERTGPTLRDSISFENYVSFWEGFDDVKVRDVDLEESGNTATADFEYRYPDGEREREEHRLTFRVGEDGQLLLDSDRPIG
ncbi:serine/threonine-protein kinase [Blastococcus montanus]|uniref:serine/threonine-protein kinase n=1 Tax=Blastococcus montanus TaxID=3144973 RepID=UPI003207C0A6